MAKYAFLSEEWMEAAKAIRDEYKDQVKPPAHSIRMNQVVTDVPFGDGTIEAHLDTSSGEILWRFPAGGSVVAGPAVVDGTVYWGSGYARTGGIGNDQFFAFSLGGR